MGFGGKREEGNLHVKQVKQTIEEESIISEVT